jgi:hypothetical protein
MHQLQITTEVLKVVMILIVELFTELKDRCKLHNKLAVAKELKSHTTLVKVLVDLQVCLQKAWVEEIYTTIIPRWIISNLVDLCHQELQ